MTIIYMNEENHERTLVKYNHNKDDLIYDIPTYPIGK